ncbi:hypothetical protein FF38_09393 [Lucilia cuprina]|uniref:Uncharacterized protein n=1 Tax=Lucilia cuprina TaxID=7375 RepID=A0A0L0CQD2_LUCCU|nr:hypothetical protein FF38_09393 [Lucilia cuprina]
MKSLILTIVSVALLGALIEAHPQRVHYQKLPYYPPPTQRPRPIRVRRDLGGQISTNPAGGNNAKNNNYAIASLSLNVKPKPPPV